MKWYLAQIIFQIICGDGLHQPQFDEQLRLIHAEDEDGAFTKAKNIGEAEQEVFYNQKQQPVQWKFINIAELYQIALIDGAEVFSRINEVDDGKAYQDLIHLKAEQIQKKTDYTLLQLL